MSPFSIKGSIKTSIKKIGQIIKPNHEKTKFRWLKLQCKQAIATLILLQKKQHARHCVLVIGQPESGKSTLCSAQSGTLLFRNNTHEKTNEFSFEIYEQHQTLFFHVPRDFFLFNEPKLQQRAWEFLASQLKRQRNYLSITRALVCIDINDFLTRSDISNETRLSQTALALNTLACKLKTPLDVSLLFTKADLITGFNEFFDHQNKEYLEQPWGISLRALNKASGDFIASEFKQLIHQLNQQLLWRIHHEANPEKLYLIKSFPLVMEAVKNKMIEILPPFLTQWTQKKLLTSTALYFVSCRQYRELKSSISLDTATIAKNHKMENQKQFFTHDVLKTLCQYRETHAVSRLEKITRASFVVFGTLLLLAFISFTAKQFSQHLALTRTTHQVIEQGDLFIKQPLLALKLDNINHELVIINNTLNALKNNDHSLLIGRFIFSNNTALEAQLELISQHILAQQWLPMINQRLENFVRTNLASEPEQAYIAFKIYLMLNQTEKSAVRSKAIDINYINSHLAKLLGDDIILLSQLPIATPFTQSSLIQPSFVQKVREYFSGLSADKLAYILLFADLNNNSPLDLATTIDTQPMVLAVPKKFALIPTIYTEKMFTVIYHQKLLTVVHDVLQGNFVLGQQPQRSDISAESLLPKLQEEYAQLYRDAWEQALKHVALVKTDTRQDFAAQLQTLASVNSPILSLLKLSQTNTSFAPIEQSSLFLKDFNHTLTPQSTPDNSALFHSFIFLQNLNEQVLKIQTSDDPKTTACQLLKQEYAATEQKPTDAQQIRFLATQLPEPIQSWLQQLVDAYYAMLNQQAADCH